MGTLQNSEIFTLTYGALVRQLLGDYDDLEDVHKQLDNMYVMSQGGMMLICGASKID